MNAILFASLSTIGIATASVSAVAGNLTLDLENVSSNEGSIRIAVYAGQADFEIKKTIRAMVLPAQAGKMQVAVGDLPAGEYAVMMFQDINGNEKFDRNLFGIPIEPWSSSTKEFAMGSPSWEHVNFKLPAYGTTLKIDFE